MGSIPDRNSEHTYGIDPMCSEPTYGIKILETQILNVGFWQPNFYNIEDKMKMTDPKNEDNLNQTSTHKHGNIKH